jgi:hypothetical protein
MQRRALMFLLLSLLALTAPAALAQADDFDGLSRSRTGTAPAGAAAARPDVVSAGGLLEDGRNVTVARVAGAKIDFRMGRDNLAFPNLSGAVSLGGMAGNCYAMAVTAKLFFERAAYRRDGQPAGFRLEDLAAARASGSGFTVNGYDSLHALSDAPDFGEREVFDQLARERDPDPARRPPPLGGARQQVARLMQVVSTIHYLHYMQFQAGKFLEAVLRQKLSGTGQVQEVTRREIDSLAAHLDGGRTGLLLLLETTEVYGHVVLATRLTRTAGADFVEVYDSNVQHGTETRPSVLKIGRDGKVAGYFRRVAGGALVPHAIYDNDAWFAKADSLAVILLPDASLEDEEGRALAQKIGSADVETAYIMAGGHLLKALTESSPAQSTLQDDVLGFVREVQAVQSSLGRDVVERLGADAPVEALNRVLAARSDLAIRAAFPHALPPGISLTGTHVRLDPRDANRATVTSTITVAEDGPVDQLAQVVQQGASLAQYARLASWVAAVRGTVGPTRIRAEIEVELTKAELPAGGRTRYGLIPYLARSHVVIGDLLPSARMPAQHQLEISEKALQGALDTALTKLGVIDHEWKFEYVLVGERRSPGWFGRPIVLVPEVRRGGTVRLRKVAVDCAAATIDAALGLVKLDVDTHAFAEVNPFKAGLGVNVTARPAQAWLTMQRDSAAPDGHWTVRSGVDARLVVDDGLHNLLAWALLQLADKGFRFFAGRLNQTIRSRLASYAELVRPFELKDLDVDTRRLRAQLTEGVVDLRLLGRRLFSVEAPVTLTSASARDDRLVLGCDYR